VGISMTWFRHMTSRRADNRRGLRVMDRDKFA
jgi:hypothetical protein